MVFNRLNLHQEHTDLLYIVSCTPLGSLLYKLGSCPSTKRVPLPHPVYCNSDQMTINRYKPLSELCLPEQKLLNSAEVSHVWESREHADPHGYQLRKLAEVVEADSWYFYDYMSLYQFKRKVASQEKSFRRAMANMHVLYAHEHSSTLRIESLTPLDEMHMDATVLVYHAPSDEVKPVPVANLIANETAYRDRGWCIAELCWSSTRSIGSSSKEIDEAEADTEGQAPMPPEIFVPLFKEKLQFTHRSDMDAVLKLQERVSCLSRQ